MGKEHPLAPDLLKELAYAKDSEPGLSEPKIVEAQSALEEKIAEIRAELERLQCAAGQVSALQTASKASRVHSPKASASSGVTQPMLPPVVAAVPSQVVPAVPTTPQPTAKSVTKLDEPAGQNRLRSETSNSACAIKCTPYVGPLGQSSLMLMERCLHPPRFVGTMARSFHPASCFPPESESGDGAVSSTNIPSSDHVDPLQASEHAVPEEGGSVPAAPRASSMAAKGGHAPAAPLEAQEAPAMHTSSSPTPPPSSAVIAPPVASVASVPIDSAGTAGASLPKMPVRISSRPPFHPSKLALVLDVDNTLVHTVKQTSFDGPINVSAFVNEDGFCELFEWCPSNAGAECAVYVKLRPGVRKFLRELRPLYEMSIFSMGDPEYLEFVLSLIDPNRDIFPPERVASRDDLDLSDRGCSKHLRGICQHPIERVVIFDDRFDVWLDENERAHGQLALVRAYPYNFLHSRRRALVSSHLGDAFPCDRDAHLPSAARLFSEVYTDVFSPRLPSAKTSIHDSWAQTLQDLRIVIIEGARVEGRLTAAAEAFGAHVEHEVHRGLHAVVAQDYNDHRFEQAKKMGVPVVHGTWLCFCFATFALQDPAPFFHGVLKSQSRDCWEAYAEWHSGTAAGTAGARANVRDPSVLDVSVRERLERGRRRRMAAAPVQKASSCPDVPSGSTSAEAVHNDSPKDAGTHQDEEENGSWAGINQLRMQKVGIIDLE